MKRGEGDKLILDKTDRLILNEIQRNVLVCYRPVLALARRLQLKEKEVLQIGDK